VWKEARLEEILEKTGNHDPRTNQDNYFKYVDVSSVNNTSHEIDGFTELLGRNAPSRARKKIKTNDVIFATIRPTLKRVAIVPDHLNEQICSTGFFVMRPKKFIHYEFLYYYLLSDIFIGDMARKQSGASYPAVNDTQVRGHTAKYPELTEQIEMSTKVKALRTMTMKLSGHYLNKLVALKELKQSLLQKAFSGELTAADVSEIEEAVA
jgi:type I restriction enzyme S subunit